MISKLISHMISNIIMWLCHIQYKKHGKSLLYIKGLGKDYPKSLLYTEREGTAIMMDNI